MKRPSELLNTLKSKLHSRMIQYDVFSFVDDVTVVITHVQSLHAKCSIPFVLIGNDLYYKDKKFVTGSKSESVGILVNQIRRAEVKLNKMF